MLLFCRLVQGESLIKHIPSTPQTTPAMESTVLLVAAQLTDVRLPLPTLRKHVLVDCACHAASLLCLA